MDPAIKILIGIILIVGSIAAVYTSRGTNYDLWESFKTVIMGIVPPFVFLVGVFIVWLELDELRIERELKTEKKKRRKK